MGQIALFSSSVPQKVRIEEKERKEIKLWHSQSTQTFRQSLHKEV